MNTKYLKHFNVQLKRFREKQQLDHTDIAHYCLVDASVAEAWEQSSPRCYPSLDNLLDLCFRTGANLEQFIDVPTEQLAQQLDLPGLSAMNDADLSDTLAELDAQLDRFMPSHEELELIQKFRKSNKQNKELILQLIGH